MTLPTEGQSKENLEGVESEKKTFFTASKNVDIPTKQGLHSFNSSKCSTDVRAEAITANWFLLIEKEIFPVQVVVLRFVFVAVFAT